MSDISIPGVSSRFNTESMVKELVEAESVRLERMQSELDTYQQEKRVWQDINAGLNSLRQSARTLYSFENPFNERNAISGEEAVLRATATREASEGVTEVRVIQIARADRFISDDIDRELQIGEGIYTFTVGDDSVTVRFRGGSVKEFSDAINRRNPELLRSSVINNRPGSQVILIESLREGAANPLGFEGDARDLALQLGWVEQARDTSSSINMETTRVSQWTKDLDNQPLSRQGEVLRIGPGAEFSLPFPEAVEITDGMILRYEVRLSTNEDYRYVVPEQAPGPDRPDGGSVSLRDVTLPDLPSAVDLPEDVEPEPPEIIEESRLLFARNRNTTIPLPEVNESLNFVEVEVSIAELTSRLDAINITNPNTLKDLEIRNIEVIDPNARGDLRPKNAVSSARDALIEVEGIRIERESNSIDDVIPGVTLELRRESDDDVEITIEPDRDLVKDTLIEWVARYNQIIRDVNILTRTDPAIIDEIEYFSDEERERYTERLGMFQGDITLNTLKNRLQTITMSPFDTRAGNDLSLLAQIGISTNASGGGSGVNVSRLRGYLEINEQVLDEALAQNFLAVKDLFGRDSDGDLVIDQGAAYMVDSFVNPYVQIGGIIAGRTSRYDGLISETTDDISDYEEYLEDYEAEQRRQFGTMEAAINSMEQSSQGLQNLNNNNNN
jgi:flagellar hook-associated protein 2